jgi:hypothetical protein
MLHTLQKNLLGRVLGQVFEARSHEKGVDQGDGGSKHPWKHRVLGKLLAAPQR